MNHKEAEQKLRDQINVTPQQVTYAKAFFLKNFNSSTLQLIKSLLTSLDEKFPGEITVNLSSETDDAIKKVASAIIWTLAGCEAIWGLISANLLIPAALDLRLYISSIGWTTVTPGSGGNSGGWNLQDLSLPVPPTVLVPHSGRCREKQPLSDPDLFLYNLDIPNIHKEVEDSLREAVRCFRHELYLACLAMLGKASEGAWIELGLKLVKKIRPSTNSNPDKIKENLEDPFIGIGKKIKTTLKLYENKETFGLVYKKSTVKIQDLRNVAIWADAVRESRNSVHYGAEPSMPNTYEKVAALLLGAVPHLRLIYQIETALDNWET